MGQRNALHCSFQRVTPCFATESVMTINRRLMAGLALSAVVHLALVMGIGVKPSAYAPSRPLEVYLLPEAISVDAERATRVPPASFVREPDSAAPSERSHPQQPPVPLHSEALAPSAPEAPLLQLEAPLVRYYTAREVDVRAEQINEVDLVYPKRAYENRTKGKVLLRIYINEHGGIDNATILESTPSGIFEEAALEATLSLRFKPAVKASRNVKSLKTIEVVFDPYEKINIP